MLHCNVGKTRRLKTEPAAGVDVVGALFADLHLKIRGSGRWIVLRAIAHLGFKQIEAHYAGTDAVQAVIVGAIGAAVRTCWDIDGWKSQQGAVAKSDLAEDIGAEGQIVGGNVRWNRAFYHFKIEVSRASIARNV